MAFEQTLRSLQALHQVIIKARIAHAAHVKTYEQFQNVCATGTDAEIESARFAAVVSYEAYLDAMAAASKVGRW